MPAPSPAPDRLLVDATGRRLARADGSPFFWLADTAWELFHRPDADEADHYLATRAAQGFNAVQAVILAELDGLTEPTPAGHVPLEGGDPDRPVEGYFAGVDRVVRRANDLGLVACLLPTWGDKVNRMWGRGPEIFDPDNARRFGRYLGDRYRGASVAWMLGGDRPVETPRHLLTWRAMAEGLRDGDGGRGPITYHPNGGHRSGESVGGEAWLDFGVTQSGHWDRDMPVAALLAAELAADPPRPALDAEPCYEDHPLFRDVRAQAADLPANADSRDFAYRGGWLGEHDVRKAAWRAALAGACGHTYGCHGVWQFYDPSRHPPVTFARTPWHEALHLPGAGQMRHLGSLMASRPDLIAAAARPDDARPCAALYSPDGQPVALGPGALPAGEHVVATWLDPRDGSTRPAAAFARAAAPPALAPPADPGPDWVLLLDGTPRPSSPPPHPV